MRRKVHGPELTQIGAAGTGPLCPEVDGPVQPVADVPPVRAYLGGRTAAWSPLTWKRSLPSPFIFPNPALNHRGADSWIAGLPLGFSALPKSLCHLPTCLNCRGVSSNCAKSRQAQGVRDRTGQQANNGEQSGAKRVKVASNPLLISGCDRLSNCLNRSCCICCPPCCSSGVALRIRLPRPLHLRSRPVPRPLIQTPD